MYLTNKYYKLKNSLNNKYFSKIFLYIGNLVINVISHLKKINMLIFIYSELAEN